MTNPWYTDYAAFLEKHFPGRKMQKLSVDAGFSCPNRDGTIGRGGCIYCNVSSFSPLRAKAGESIPQQLARSRDFFRHKYREMGYLAYFQAYTNTHSRIPELMAMYREALETPGVEGLVIGTRPDCMPQSLLAQLKELGKFVMIEYGAETACDRTLSLINRCHTWADTKDAVERTHAAGIPVGLHLIMGLPGESREDMMATIEAVNALPVDVVKIHQLQILRNTELERKVRSGEMQLTPLSLDDYLDLCIEFIHRLRPGIAIDRFVSQAPDSLLVAPRWGLKNYQFTHLLHNRLKSLFPNIC